MTQKHSHYFKPVPPGVTHIDVYRVLEMFKVTDQCLGHAMKKLLVAGGRGAGKNIDQDIQEAIDSLLRWQAMQAENNSSPVTDSAQYDIDKVLDSALPEAASWYPNITMFHINKALNDPDKGVREAAIKNPNVTTSHIDKALDDTDIDVRYAAINHPNATPNNISKALDMNQPECVRVAAIGHPNVTAKQIGKTLNDKKWWVRIGAVRHPNATLAHINKGLEDSSYLVQEAAAKIKKERNL